MIPFIHQQLLYDNNTIVYTPLLHVNFILSRVNLTSEEPVWTVRGLEWDVRFRLVAVAVNSKGRSAAARLDDLLFPDPEKRTGTTYLSNEFCKRRHIIQKKPCTALLTPTRELNSMFWNKFFKG